MRHARCYLSVWACVIAGWMAVACTDIPRYTYRNAEGEKGVISLECVNDSLYILHHTVNGTSASDWELPYPVYRFECGDLTGDGIPEIAVGVIKPTRYFPRPEKRLFLFKLYKERWIRPLWLGSRLARPLMDFQMVHDSVPARILTTERRADGSFVQALYRQEGFGLIFERDISH